MTDDILFDRRGTLGVVTLNRPAAMNALTHAMALALDARLQAWADDDAIETVAILGAGDRAFCAGGDIRALHGAGAPGGVQGQANFAFYHDEYLLNARIKSYSKPYVAIMDGITMGGGVGVSLHGSLRIATERTLFAMPETGIGLFPDVGATWFLPRLPGRTGMWLGLTGARLKGAETVAAGLCDTILESGDLPALLDRLADGDLPAPIPRPDRSHAADIDRLFAGDSVEAILQALDTEGSDWATKQAVTIRSKSPTCTRIAHRQITEGADLTFEDCMRLEYRLARFCMMAPDFYEGVRALIIDKDNAPVWSPATLVEADDAHVATAFAPLGDEELPL